MKSQLVVWSWPVRILHWLIATSIVLNLFFLEQGDPPHMWSGYVAVSLVICRCFMGFFGEGAARFSNWPIAWVQLRQFYVEQTQGKPRPYPGHNPLASYAYFAIWGLIFALGISGWMMGLDVFWGEDWVQDLHKIFSLVLQGLVLVHWLGMLLDSYHFRRKTWLAMITGRRGDLP